jgi:predicted nuclease of restriction endonuclease-like RecB superfamily
VRHAKFRGLLCQVKVCPSKGKPILEISGPFMIIRKTILYGRALSGLVPLLAWCDQFTLTADCAIEEKEYKLMIRSGDPIFPAAEPKHFDSRLEERFSKDFQKAAPEWEIIREPEPVEACGTLIFPDFLLRHRYDCQRSWMLEIAGFWTSDYLTRKLETLKAAGLSNLIICMDEEKNCGEVDLHPGTRLVRFKRRVDVNQVLKIISHRSHP